jgi:hypothetical protein
MIPERMLELIILNEIADKYNNDSYFSAFLDTDYNIEKLNDRYMILTKEFLNDYALNKTEKSD